MKFTHRIKDAGKRTLAVLLALFLSVSLLPAAVFAADIEVAEGDTFEYGTLSYTVNDQKLAIVTGVVSGQTLTGETVIPATVSYEKEETTLSAVVGGIALAGDSAEAMQSLTALGVQVAVAGYTIAAGTFGVEVTTPGVAPEAGPPETAGTEAAGEGTCAVTVYAVSGDMSPVGLWGADNVTGATVSEAEDIRATVTAQAVDSNDAPYDDVMQSAEITLSPNFLATPTADAYLNDAALLYKFTAADALEVVQALNPAIKSFNIPTQVKVKNNSDSTDVPVTAIAAGAFAASPAGANFSLSVRTEGLAIGADAFTAGQTVSISPAAQGFFSTWSPSAAAALPASASTTLTSRGGITLVPEFTPFGVGIALNDGTYTYKVTKADEPFALEMTGLVDPDSCPSTVKPSLKIRDSSDGVDRIFDVTSIADGAFSGKTGITSVIIPKSVTNIGANAFAGCPIASGSVTVGGNSEGGSLTVGSGAFDTFGNITVKGATVSGYTYELSGQVSNKKLTGAGTVSVVYAKKEGASADNALDTDTEKVGEYKEVYLGNATFINGGETGSWLDVDNQSNGNYTTQSDGTYIYTYGMQSYYKTIDNAGYNMFANFGIYTQNDWAKGQKSLSDKGFNVKIYKDSWSDSHDVDLNSEGISGAAIGEEADFTVSFTEEYPELYAFASSENARIFFGAHLQGNINSGCSGTDYDHAEVTVRLRNSSNTAKKEFHLVTGNDSGRGKDMSTGWLDVDPGDKLSIHVQLHGDAEGVGASMEKTLLLFRDDLCPVLEDYALTTNGDAHMNSGSGKNEILLGLADAGEGKPNGEIDMTVNFSKPVISMLDGLGDVGDLKQFYDDGGMTNYVSDDAKLLDQFANHILFYNTEGTGFAREKEPVYLSLTGSAWEKTTSAVSKGGVTAAGTGAYTAKSQNAALTTFFNKLSWQWVAQNGDYYGNNAVPNAGDWIGSATTNNYTFLDKLVLASFHDAAGNPLKIKHKSGGTDQTLFATEPYADMLRGKITAAQNQTFTDTTGGPFEQAQFIIDANQPTYSKTSNGIQPVILTKVVLNDQDVVRFQVNFSESTVVRRYDKNGVSTGWRDDETYLQLNNGLKAEYVSGAGTKQWVFEAKIPAGKEAEIKTLAITALAHHQRPYDTYVLTDYVGNPLIEAAGTSSIAWAALQVDNTPPALTYSYSADTGSGNATAYGKTAAVTVTAADPALQTGGAGSGIFVPSNTTSGGDKVGLVYYVWVEGTQARDKAISDLSANNYAAVKKYSLSAEQPKGYTLAAANNKTPIAAPSGSGEWYLVVFTADMTWDSARQLIQYDKLKTFKAQEDTAKKYFAWLLGELNVLDDLTAENESEILSGISANSIDEDKWVGGFKKLESDPDNWSSVYASYYKYVNGEYVNFTSETKDESVDRYEVTGAIAKALMAKAGGKTDVELMAKFTNADTFVKLVAAMEPYAAFNDAEYKADQKGMTESGAYEKWTQADYAKKDSNWVCGSTKVLLDNTAPTVTATVANDGTKTVTVTVNAADAHSGLAKLEYQFTAKDTDPTGTWTQFDGDYSAAAITTGILGDGEYDLYVKATDKVGLANAETKLATVKKDSAITLGTPTPNVKQEGDTCRKKLEGVTATMSGMVEGTSVFNKGFHLYYAFDASSAKEGAAEGWTELTSADTGAERVFSIGDLGAGQTGTRYLHLKFTYTGQGDPAIFHYSYKLDNTPPTAAFNPDGIEFAQETVTVEVKANDGHSAVKDGSVRYMWAAATADEPTAASAGWVELPANRLVTTDAETMGLQAGEQGSYKIYIFAEDTLGNKGVTASKTFLLERPVSIQAPTVAGDLASLTEKDGEYTAVLQLTADAAAEALIKSGRTGYSYSVAVVNGDEPVWSRWIAYESFVYVKLGTTTADKSIQVKFRSPSGEITQESDWLRFNNLSPKENALWATVAREKQKKLGNGDSMTLTLTAPEGVSVTGASNLVTSGAAPQQVEQTNAYTVTDNGYYAFTLHGEGADETLKVCVDNFDTVPPNATVTFSELVLTNANVTAILNPSETVTVSKVEFTPSSGVTPTETQTDGGMAYLFKENGTAKFTFADEAGNVNTTTAFVTWIDKTAPIPSVAESYTYTKNDQSYTFNHGAAGAPRGGVVLTVSADDPDFTVLSGGDAIGGKTAVVRANGDYTFTVRDKAGNTKSVTYPVTGIINAMPQPTTQVVYTLQSRTKAVESDWTDEEATSMAQITPQDGKEYRTWAGYKNGVLVNLIQSRTKTAVGAWEDVADLNAARDEEANEYRYVAKVTVSGTVDSQFGASSPVYEGYGVLDETDEAGASLNPDLIHPTDANDAYSFTKVYTSNGTVNAAVCDALGNVATYSVKLDQIDNEAPAIRFDGLLYMNMGASVTFDDAWLSGLGKYTVSDDATAANELVVTLEKHNINQDVAGAYTVTYRVADKVGNVTTKTRNIYVVPTEGLLVTGDDVLFYSKSKDAALLPDNSIKFYIDRYKLMKYGNFTVTNEWAYYDIYIQKGLYREGQLKYIQTVKLKEQMNATITIAPEQLKSGGWYTIIVRNSEREREYTTFFISSVLGS